MDEHAAHGRGRGRGTGRGRGPRLGGRGRGRGGRGHGVMLAPVAGPMAGSQMENKTS